MYSLNFQPAWDWLSTSVYCQILSCSWSRRNDFLRSHFSFCGHFLAWFIRQEMKRKRPEACLQAAYNRDWQPKVNLTKWQIKAHTSTNQPLLSIPKSYHPSSLLVWHQHPEVRNWLMPLLVCTLLLPSFSTASIPQVSGSCNDTIRRLALWHKHCIKTISSDLSCIPN